MKAPAPGEPSRGTDAHVCADRPPSIVLAAGHDEETDVPHPQLTWEGLLDCQIGSARLIAKGQVAGFCKPPSSY